MLEEKEEEEGVQNKDLRLKYYRVCRECLN